MFVSHVTSGRIVMRTICATISRRVDSARQKDAAQPPPVFSSLLLVFLLLDRLNCCFFWTSRLCSMDFRQDGPLIIILLIILTFKGCCPFFFWENL